MKKRVLRRSARLAKLREKKISFCREIRLKAFQTRRIRQLTPHVDSRYKWNNTTVQNFTLLLTEHTAKYFFMQNLQRTPPSFDYHRSILCTRQNGGENFCITLPPLTQITSPHKILFDILGVKYRYFGHGRYGVSNEDSQDAEIWGRKGWLPDQKETLFSVVERVASYLEMDESERESLEEELEKMFDDGLRMEIRVWGAIATYEKDEVLANEKLAENLHNIIKNDLRRLNINTSLLDVWEENGEIFITHGSHSDPTDARLYKCDGEIEMELDYDTAKEFGGERCTTFFLKHEPEKHTLVSRCSIKE